MSETLDDKYFDFAFKILNYAVEFVNSPGYASLRITDVLEKTVELSSQIEEVSRTEFYEKVKDKFRDRRIMASSGTRADFLDELMSMFIDEWRKTASP